MTSILSSLGKAGETAAEAAADDDEAFPSGAGCEDAEAAAAEDAEDSFLAPDDEDAEEDAAALLLPRPWGAGDGDGELGDSVGDRSTGTTMAVERNPRAKGGGGKRRGNEPLTVHDWQVL